MMYNFIFVIHLMLNKYKMIHHTLNRAHSLFLLYINYLNFYNCICTHVHINLNFGTFDF